MKKTLALVSSCLLLVGVSGCGTSPDTLRRDQIRAMNDMAEAIEKNEPEGKISEIKARIEQNNKKMEQLKLSDDDKKKLAEKHKDELMQAMTRLQKAMLNRAAKDFGSGIPGMPAFGEKPCRRRCRT
jgi:hypothetical protein